MVAAVTHDQRHPGAHHVLAEGVGARGATGGGPWLGQPCEARKGLAVHADHGGQGRRRAHDPGHQSCQPVEGDIDITLEQPGAG